MIPGTPAHDHYDLIIVGTGAGGGTLAQRLAPTGLRILVLERGEYLPRERENWDAQEVFEHKRYLARETFYDRNDQPFEPYTHYCVGGNTKVYGAALLRLREADFGELRHSGGVSPAWPVGYDQFEPYYTRAERLMHAHGERGSDPLEPRSSAPLPHPPVPPEPRIAQLMDDLRAAGVRPFPIPLGVRLDQRPRGDAPYRLSQFDGYPDLTEIKADAHVCGIRPALAQPNVTLMTGAYVERLITSPSGREVKHVVVRHGGAEHRFSADVVALACGAINTAALLLRSGSGGCRDGLANSSGMVGRNLMVHQNGCVIAVVSEPNTSAFQKHFGLTDFYLSGPHTPHPLGMIQLMGKPDMGTLSWLRGGALPQMTLEQIAARTIDFFITAEDLPAPDNRVTLRQDGSIRVSYVANNTAAYDGLQQCLQALMIGAERRHGRPDPVFLASRLGNSGVSHQNGTCRFGVDPATSVLNLDCRAHDVDNLYVVDGSFFPSSGAVNPSLTIAANALRVGDHLARRLNANTSPELAVAS